MEELIESIKRHEGLRLKPYVCTQGKTSIGYGRNLADVGISKAEAEMMLKTDIARIVCEFYKLPLPVIKNCNKARRRVLCEMVFQLGLGGVLKFKRMLSAIEQSNFGLASIEMIDSKWYDQTPNRVEELAEIIRRG